MKRILIGLSLIISHLSFSSVAAQTQLTKYHPGVTPEGAVYYLPKTAMRFVVQVEKTNYTPGEFAGYAEYYLALHDVKTTPTVNYRVTDIKMTTYGEADTAKCYVVKFNVKTAASNMQLTDDGILLAINPQSPVPNPLSAIPQPSTFTTHRPTLDPRLYLNEDILAAGSVAKRAELIAQEILTIRESKNMLTRGEADYMPKDGEQLRIMLEQLDLQNQALSQFFSGTTTCDTIEHVITLCPTTEVKNNVLFRLSQQLGLVDADDLSGEPYYITVEDLHTVAPPVVVEEGKKKKVPESGIYVNVPGRIRVSVTNSTKTLLTSDFLAGQFGNVELLSGELFNKRYTTHVLLNPVTGGMEKLDADMPR